MAVAGGLKLDGRLLILASAVFTASLPLLVFGISHGRREQSGDKLVDFAYLGVLFRSVNPYFFAALGIATAIGFSVLGAAWCVFRVSRRIIDPSAPWARLARPRARDPAPRGPAVVFARAHEARAFVFTLETEKARRTRGVVASRSILSRRSDVISPFPMHHHRTSQGHLHHWFLAGGRRRARAEDHEQEPDQRHLLRSRRHLRLSLIHI